MFQILNISKFKQCRPSTCVDGLMLWVLFEFSKNKSTSNIFNLKSKYLIKSNDKQIVQPPLITFHYYNFDFHIWLPSRNSPLHMCLQHCDIKLPPLLIN